MRVFNTPKEALNEVTRDVFSRGVKSYDRTVQSVIVSEDTHWAKELVGYNYTIATPTMDGAIEMMKYAAEIFNKEHFTPEYAQDWLDEIIEGNINPSKAHLKHWKEYWETYEEMLNVCGRFAYTYSERLAISIPAIINLLTDNKYRRAAFAAVWNSDDIKSVGQYRVPCSIGYHFLIRKEGPEDQLHLIYMQRSCSLAEFFPFDMYRAIGLLHHVAGALDVKPGNVIHFISSLHCFYKDLKDTSRVW